MTDSIRQTTESEIRSLRHKFQSLIARDFSPRGFRAFYQRVHGNKIPDHAYNGWVKHIFDAKAQDKGALIFAFRGSWKTTTITKTFTAFFIGHHPERSNLIIQASDASSNTTTQGIVNIIEHTDAWQQCFPHVRPDKSQGWGEKGGYEVKRTDIPYEEWREIKSSSSDPTVLGLGIGSSTLIGKHPDGVLLLDDIHDEDNTRSMRQLQSVDDKVTGTILPFIVEDESRPEGERLTTWPIVIGTPWVENDSYDTVKNTGEFVFSNVPIMEETTKEDENAVYFSHGKLTGEFKLGWPGKYNKESIIRLYNRSGYKEFYRMYLLDKTIKAEGTGLKFHTYPSQDIDPKWPMVCGVDYASIDKEKNLDLKYRSYYAQAYLLKMPDGRGVVFDGIHERCSQAEAEAHMEGAESFPSHRYTIFEADGKGEEALQIFLRNPGLTLIPKKTRNESKSDRLEKQLGPWLENGTILISDGNTPFLNFLRKNLRLYPDYHKDAVDAVYWASRGMPEILQLNNKRSNKLPAAKKFAEKTGNPFHAFSY